jgi:hypothetical protein
VVCHSYGYAPIVTATSVRTLPFQLSFNSYRDTLFEIPVDPTTTAVTLHPLLEGSLIRVFKYKGKVYFSTHRKLSAARSKWAGGNTFKTLYDKLGGPSEEVCFPEGCGDTVPYVYSFLINHSQLLMASHMPLQEDEGYLVYLGCEKMFEQDENNGELQSTTKQVIQKGLMELSETLGELDESLKGLVKDTVNQIMVSQRPFTPTVFPNLKSSWFDTCEWTSEKKFMVNLPSLTEAEANSFLEKGWLMCKGKEEGEGILVILTDRNSGAHLATWKVFSPAYAKRLFLRGSSPNLEFQLFQLYNLTAYQAGSKPEATHFLRKYCYLEKPIDVTKGLYPSQRLPLSFHEYYAQMTTDRRADRFVFIFDAYLKSVPLHRRPEVVKYYLDFFNNMDTVYEWLRDGPRSVDAVHEHSHPLLVKYWMMKKEDVPEALFKENTKVWYNLLKFMRADLQAGKITDLGKEKNN